MNEVITRDDILADHLLLMTSGLSLYSSMQWELVDCDRRRYSIKNVKFQKYVFIDVTVCIVLRLVLAIDFPFTVLHSNVKLSIVKYGYAILRLLLKHIFIFQRYILKNTID